MRDELPPNVADELRASLATALPEGFHDRLAARRGGPVAAPRSASGWLVAFYAINGVLITLGAVLAVAVEVSPLEAAPVRALLRLGFAAILLGMLVGVALLVRVGRAVAEESPTYSNSAAFRVAAGALVFAALAAVSGLNVVWITLRLIQSGADARIFSATSAQMISMDAGILAAAVAIAFMQRVTVLVRRARAAGAI